jgi:hypothetical protein
VETTDTPEAVRADGTSVNLNTGDWLGDSTRIQPADQTRSDDAAASHRDHITEIGTSAPTLRYDNAGVDFDANNASTRATQLLQHVVGRFHVQHVPGLHAL